MTTERTKQEAAPQKAPTTAMTRPKASWPMVTIGIFATIIGLAIIAVAWIMIALASSYVTNSQNTKDSWMLHDDSTDTSESSDTRDMIRGVVTDFEGDFLTVRGDGREVIVLVTDDVTVSGSKRTVAINDTVVMYGSEYDDGTFEAEHIVIRNNPSAGDNGGYEQRPSVDEDRRQMLPSA
jgi:hypothetical protein